MSAGIIRIWCVLVCAQTFHAAEMQKPVDLGEEFLNATANSGDVLVPDRLNVLEWILGIVGFGPTTTEPPEILQEPEYCPPCKCGLTNTRKRIVGGHETMENEYPWMALLQYGGRFYCGASVISSKYVVTAAHCVHGFKKERITVRIMEHDRNSKNKSRIITRRAKRLVRHSSYSNYNYDHDIALIKLDEDLMFDEELRPVCLPTLGRSFSGHNGIVTGWGAIEEQGELATKLQEVTVPIMSNVDCKKTSYGSRKITDNMMCAGFPEGERDSCQGDSGGPLHVLNGTVHSIAGIVSWGEGCAQKDYPGVYTRVNRYITWLKTNTKDACYCDES